MSLFITELVNFSGFYTGWLLPAAVVGVLVFLYGVATMDMNQIALEVCNEGSNYEVNPLALCLLAMAPKTILERLPSVRRQLSRGPG